jgi:hypothetical protein
MGKKNNHNGIVYGDMIRYDIYIYVYIYTYMQHTYIHTYIYIYPHNMYIYIIHAYHGSYNANKICAIWVCLKMWDTGIPGLSVARSKSEDDDVMNF